MDFPIDIPIDEKLLAINDTMHLSFFDQDVKPFPTKPKKVNPLEISASMTYDQLAFKEEEEEGIVEPKSLSTQQTWALVIGIIVGVIFLYFLFMSMRRR